jgi:hypothetical protein
MVVRVVVSTTKCHNGVMSNTFTPNYPHINIPLVGEDGNAFSILGRVSRIMKRNGIHDKWDEFHAEATSGDYNNLLMTVMRWFAVDEDGEEEW